MNLDVDMRTLCERVVLYSPVGRSDIDAGFRKVLSVLTFPASWEPVDEASSLSHKSLSCSPGTGTRRDGAMDGLKLVRFLHMSCRVMVGMSQWGPGDTSHMYGLLLVVISCDLRMFCNKTHLQAETSQI
nr:hypothetical protein CFP56_10384 [Quercus suber]